VSRVAVVLFNLGGPDSLKAVRPFLFNLFRDPAIIQLPTIARLPLAALISTTRNKTAQANYALMGGASPLLRETQAQAVALEAHLRTIAPERERACSSPCATGSRSPPRPPARWRPSPRRDRAAAALSAVLDHHDRLVLADWARAYTGRAAADGLLLPDRRGLARPTPRRSAGLGRGGQPANVRLLFSAHGLPQQVVDAGDPYEAQIHATAAAIAALCRSSPTGRSRFQSRVGRLKWLEPSTETAIRQAAPTARAC
jgi:ferrochelatase